MCCHPTADDLFQRVRERLPRISLATVYRNLDLLAQENLVVRLDNYGPKRRYDGNPQAHYHIRCECCGCLGDLSLPQLAVPLQQVQEQTDFELRGFDLEFSGLCPACRTHCPETKGNLAGEGPGSSEGS